MLEHQTVVETKEQDGTQYGEGPVGSRAIGMDVLHHGELPVERGGLRAEAVANDPLGRREAEIVADRDAQRAQIDARQAAGNLPASNACARRSPRSRDRADPAASAPRGAALRPQPCAPSGRMSQEAEAPAPARRPARCPATGGTRPHRKKRPDCASCRRYPSRSRSGTCRSQAPPPSRPRNRRSSWSDRADWRWRHRRNCAYWRPRSIRDCWSCRASRLPPRAGPQCWHRPSPRHYRERFPSRRRWAGPPRRTYP